MEAWAGIGAILFINAVGWFLSIYLGGRKEAKEAAKEARELGRELGALNEKVDTLSKRIDDGLTEDVKGLDRRLRNIEVKIGAGGNR